MGLGEGRANAFLIQALLRCHRLLISAAIDNQSYRAGAGAGRECRIWPSARRNITVGQRDNDVLKQVFALDANGVAPLSQHPEFVPVDYGIWLDLLVVTTIAVFIACPKFNAKGLRYATEKKRISFKVDNSDFVFSFLRHKESSFYLGSLKSLRFLVRPGGSFLIL